MKFLLTGASGLIGKKLVKKSLGPDLRTKLCPTGDAIGQQVRIGSQAFEVIGVMAPKGAVFGSNQDENAYIPLSTMVNRLTGRDPTYGISLSFISVEAKNDKSTGAAKFQITNLLRQRHRILRDDDFAVRSQKDALTIVGTITGGLTLMLASIGGISLLVGGIGIMNIMLVSVSERTEVYNHPSQVEPVYYLNNGRISAYVFECLADLNIGQLLRMAGL